MVYQRLQRCGTRQFRTLANAIRGTQTGSKQRVGKLMPYTLISSNYCTKGILQPQIRAVDQPLGPKLCGTVAGLLSKAGVENILWGTHLQAVYTVPTCLLELSFVVAGSQLQKAVTVLESESFMLCRNKSCEFNTARDCQALSFDNPHAHFHLDDLSAPLFFDDYETVKLYTIEDKLWELPVLGRGVNFTDDPSNNIIFANDLSLFSTRFQGTGYFLDSVLGVRIPTLHRYVEALIMLALREPNAFSTCAWVSELVYVVHLVDMDRLSHPAFKRLCSQVINGDVGFKTMIEQAYKALGPRIRKDTHWTDVQVIRDTWE